MAVYFDPTADTDLVRTTYRTVLGRVVTYADIAENDVLSHFTDAQGVVQLRGFDADLGKIAPALKLALKATIAELTMWRLAQVDVDPLVQSKESDKNKTVYRSDAVSQYPDGWDARLLRFALAYEVPMPDLWAF